ncbi:unnamed protein product [marine sediment metagenome]|uniref:Uncharacterized protein n=1 Tax=marine sediment metagenome TaxID=412755 RepID=X0XHR4_9ZZZZ
MATPGKVRGIVRLISEDITVNNGIISEEQFEIPTGPGKYVITFHSGYTYEAVDIEMGRQRHALPGGSPFYFAAKGHRGAYTKQHNKAAKPKRWIVRSMYQYYNIPTVVGLNRYTGPTRGRRKWYELMYDNYITFNPENVHSIESIGGEI